MEIHLAILDGVKDRYETPYFDNLKHYAQRPIGTFHALPIARGKSIFKSNWIRDMGEFYGVNLFLAESSATTGGLDSLLEPTGNIKVAQDKAARALGGDRSFFVTNGTSTSNKIVHQALLPPGRHRPDRPRLPQVAPLRAGAGRRAAALHRRLPAHPVLDVRQPRHPADQEGAPRSSRPRASSTGRSMVVLTNCTFDGHVANVEAHDAGVPRDQAGPHLPLGRGVVRLRALLAVPAAAHGDGRGGGAPRADARSGVPEALRGVQGAASASSIRRTRSSSTCSSCPTPTRCACASTRPTRCTSRCRRSARARSSSSPTRTSTRSRPPSRRRSSPTPRPRRTCRSSPRSTSRAGRWSWRATSSSGGPSSWRSSSGARSTRIRSSRSTSASPRRPR